MLWALQRNDPRGWLAGDQSVARLLIETNDGPFKHHLDRYKYSSRYAWDPIEHRTAGSAILAGLDHRLASQSQLTGDAVSLADIAIMPFVRQFAGADRTWFDAQPLPDLQAWLAGHLRSDLFTACMVRHPRWEPGTTPVHFPSSAA
jgi:glutathione S-transferase